MRKVRNQQQLQKKNVDIRHPVRKEKWSKNERTRPMLGQAISWH